MGWESTGIRQVTFRLPLSTLMEPNGSGASLSGLVQLPPVEGKDVELSDDASDESENVEHGDSGRLVLSPRSLSPLKAPPRSLCKGASMVGKICAAGVLGGET